MQKVRRVIKGIVVAAFFGLILFFIVSVILSKKNEAVTAQKTKPPQPVLTQKAPQLQKIEPHKHTTAKSIAECSECLLSMLKNIYKSKALPILSRELKYFGLSENFDVEFNVNPNPRNQSEYVHAAGLRNRQNLH